MLGSDKRQIAFLAWFGIALCGCARLMAQPSTQEAVPKHALLAREAFKKLDEKEYQRAISLADECIEDFRRDADTKQQELRDKNAPKPPVGHVADDKQKQEILSNGTLNDVAGCFFIQGEVYRRQSRDAKREQEKKALLAKAKTAYESAAAYTYARIYDPTPPTWFWDPSKAANDRLADIEPQR